MAMEITFVEEKDAPKPISSKQVTKEQREANTVIEAGVKNLGKVGKLAVVDGTSARAMKVRLFHATARYNAAFKDANLLLESWDNDGAVFFKLTKVAPEKATKVNSNAA